MTLSRATMSDIHRVCLAAILAMTQLAGCDSTPKRPPEISEFPSYASLAALQNDRVAALGTTYAEGVIELAWRDESGNHFHQASLEVWLVLPRRTAWRVDKLGEVLFWMGSDSDRWWFFDLASKQKTLHIGRHENAPAHVAAGAFAVRPAALIDLLGLSPLPVPGETVEVRYDASHNAWMIETDQEGGVMRMFLHRTRMLPIRVEALDASGNVAVFSKLSIDRYVTVRVPGMAVASHPRMPGLVDIATSDQAHGAGTESGGQVKIAIDRATGDVDQQTLERVFDLARLRQAMPVEVLNQEP